VHTVVVFSPNNGQVLRGIVSWVVVEMVNVVFRSEDGADALLGIVPMFVDAASIYVDTNVSILSHGTFWLP
jgi:hypothetical protein